jgi:GT2 family glycosyltransferase
MEIAVLSLTRDRVEYTRHCFASLRENAGCDFDHFVLDQASDDGTHEFLEEYDTAALFLMDDNVGIHRGHNILLDAARGDFDVYATFDNDCEVVMPGTLAACARVANRGDWIVSPVVEGLNFPPQPGAPVDVDVEPVGPFPAIGGIFRCMPGWFADEFRFDETMPPWGGDERAVGAVAGSRGVGMGYLLDWHVNHYETTRGQEARYPAYFSRKAREFQG